MQDRTYISGRGLGLVVGLVTCCLATASYAETCKTNIAIEDPATKQVCATWDQGPDPVLNTDFTVDYECTGCEDAPRVVFITGATPAPAAWVLYSEVISSGAAANLGDVVLNPTVASDKFSLSIKNGSGAGAADVASIVLDDAGFTGYSNLGATRISGSVNGAITLIEFDDGINPPVGGEVTGLVFIGYASPYSGVKGPITIPKVHADIEIFGDYGVDTASHAIDIGEIAENATFNIGGDILSSTSSALAIDIGALGDTTETTHTGGIFRVDGSITNSKATVTITDMKAVAGSACIVDIGGDFGGTLDLKQGVPGSAADNTVQIGGELLAPNASDEGGKVKLNNKTVSGNLNFGATASGSEILNGGQLTGVFYPCASSGEFKGTATFTSVAAGAAIWSLSASLSEADISGTITINGDYAGFFKVDGKLLSGATIIIDGDLKAHSGEDGLLWIVENVDSGASVTITGDIIGHIHFPKLFNGDVTINGGILNNGLFKVGDVVLGPHNGDLTIGASMDGDVDIEGPMRGTISVTNDVSGDIHLHSDLSTFTSSISVGGSLRGRGRILVDGSCDGSITVGKDASSLSLIHCKGGLAANAKIKINTTEGDFNADGDIHVGPIAYYTPTPPVPPPPITFDGCIRIFKQAGGNGGDITGSIKVVGCHSDNTDLNICIDGGDGEENITINDAGCPNQPVHSCGTCT